MSWLQADNLSFHMVWVYTLAAHAITGVVITMDLLFLGDKV